MHNSGQVRSMASRRGNHAGYPWRSEAWSFALAPIRIEFEVLITVCRNRDAVVAAIVGKSGLFEVKTDRARQTCIPKVTTHDDGKAATSLAVAKDRLHCSLRQRQRQDHIAHQFEFARLLIAAFDLH